MLVYKTAVDFKTGVKSSKSQSEWWRFGSEAN